MVDEVSMKRSKSISGYNLVVECLN